MRSLKTIAIFAILWNVVSFSGMQAASLHMSKFNLGQPFYRSISVLSFSSQTQDSGLISVKFHDRNGKLLEVKEGLRVKRGDWISCSNNFCVQDIYKLPISLEKYSCFIEVNFVSLAGTVFLNSREKWGGCVPLPALPDTKHLPDFSFPQDAYLAEDGSIEIKNSGKNHPELNLSVWGFLKDREGNLIWKGRYQENVIIQPQGSLLVHFDNSLKTWQRELACTGFFVIDPGSAALERSKINNYWEVEFGACEELPSEERGDRIDFIPITLIENGNLFLSAKNQGRLPFLEATSHLETQIRYLGINRELVFEKTYFTAPSIYGFGGTKEVVLDAIPAGVCHIQIELNPKLTIKENDYLNNRIEIKICE